MTRTIQFRRYANTVTANTTGKDGELILDETNHTITVHDGVTAGGTRLATEKYVGNTSGSGSSAPAGSSLVISNNITGVISANGKTITITPPVTSLAIRAAISNPDPRRHINQAWSPPGAYANNTLYVTGQSVVFANNIYTAATGGTSNTATPPTGNGYNQIADGSVNWEYVSPTFTATTNAPTVSSNTAAPNANTYSKFYGNALSNFSSGVTVNILNDSWFRSFGCIETLSNSGINWGAPPATRGGIAFETDATSLVVVKRGYNSGGTVFGIVFVVNGQYVQPTIFQDPAGVQTIYWTLTFPFAQDRSRKLVEVLWDTSQSLGIYGVYCDAASSLWKPKGPQYGLKVLSVGDSFGASSGYGSGLQMNNLLDQAFMRLGFNDVFSNYQGGTGFTAGGSSLVYGSSSRLAYISSYQPNIIFVQGSVNDNSANQSTITAAVSAYVANVRSISGMSTTPIIISGVMNPGATIITFEGYLQNAIISIGDPNIYFIPCATDPSGPWLTGTGNISSPANNGNADAYLYSDGLHPTVRGQLYRGERLAAEIKNVLLSINP